ncbi:MAG: hypothetical protein WDN69_03040 [Aliidongia sp.]
MFFRGRQIACGQRTARHLGQFLCCRHGQAYFGGSRSAAGGPGLQPLHRPLLDIRCPGHRRTRCGGDGRGFGMRHGTGEVERHDLLSLGELDEFRADFREAPIQDHVALAQVFDTRAAGTLDHGDGGAGRQDRAGQANRRPVRRCGTAGPGGGRSAQ